MGKDGQMSNTVKGLIAGIVLALATGSSAPWWWPKIRSGHGGGGDTTAAKSHPGKAAMGALQDNTSFADNDMYYRITISPDDCAAQCVSDTSCAAVTFVKSQQKCWLKSRVGVSQYSTDMISSVKKYTQ